MPEQLATLLDRQEHVFLIVTLRAGLDEEAAPAPRPGWTIRDLRRGYSTRRPIREIWCDQYRVPAFANTFLTGT